MPNLSLWFLLAFLAGLLAPCTPSAAGDAAGAMAVAGYVERITLLPWGREVKAKLDTGAQTSSIHATDIRRVRLDGRSIVRFTLVLATEGGERRIAAERPLRRRVRIKSAAKGGFDHRYSVDLELCFGGKRRRAEFTLADRDDMIYPVLLGRRFLDGVAVVDSGRTFLTQSTCEPEEEAVPAPPADQKPEP